MRFWVRPGDLLVAGLVVAPLLLVWPRIALTAGGATGWLTLAHRVAAILALSTFLTAAIVSIRLPRMDRYFGGLTRLWRVHHVLGLASFLLVMSHVLLMGLAVLPMSKRAPIPALFPPSSVTSVWMGWLAFAFLLAFLASSFKFYGEPRYQRWKRVHLLSAAAMILSLAHALSLSSSPVVWWLLGSLAGFALLWRKLISRWLTCRPYLVTEVRTLADRVVELSLRPKGRPLRYDAGQFFYLSPYDPNLAAGYSEEHPYTATSAPAEDELRIGIKALGDATTAILKIQPGTRVLVEGPYGYFFERRYPQAGQLWMGGGIGVTPFVAAVRTLNCTANGSDRSIHLFYLADTPERAYYLDELQALAAGLQNFALTPHYFKMEGLIALKFIEAHCANFAEREVYLCGPPPMTAHIRKLLRERGVPRNRIHSEDFSLL